MDSSEKAFRELMQKLEQGIAISDGELVAALEKIRIMTNTWSAAFHIATLIAPVCGYRPHLAKQLLPRMLDPLTFSGVGKAQQVIQWLQAHLEDPEPFRGMSSVGLDWLNRLITQPNLIQEVLNDLIRPRVEYELNEHKEYFKPSIRVPMERVELWPAWHNDLLSEIKKGVVFIQNLLLYEKEPSPHEIEEAIHRKEQESMRFLENLTEALAKNDPEGKLSFLILTWEATEDLIDYFEKNDPHEVFLDVTPEKARILWILNGKGLHVLSEDVTDVKVIEDYTLDLLSQQE